MGSALTNQFFRMRLDSEGALIASDSRHIILLDNAVKYCDEGGQIQVILAPGKGRAAVLEVSKDYAAGEGVDYSYASRYRATVMQALTSSRQH